MRIKITTFIFASVALLNSNLAQPVITGITSPPLGTKTLGYLIPGAITEGTDGENQTWDYSTIPYDPSTYYFKSVDYATLSPTMQANFPTGNLGNEVYFGVSLVATQVFQLEPTFLSYLGLNTTVFPVPDTQLVFPHSYLETHAGFTYDAYGTLITPFGTFTNTVRLREIDGSNFKYDYWQFSPVYRAIMEYLVDSTTQVISGQTFFNNENPAAVNELEKNSGVELSPNPTVDNIIITTSFSGNSTVEIYDVQGKKLSSQNILVQTNAPFKMDVSYLEQGIYFVKIYNDEKIYTQKIVKE